MTKEQLYDRLKGLEDPKHKHPNDSGDGEPCKYLGADVWDCGVIDNS